MKTIAAIPAYNEEATIGSVVLRARKMIFTAENKLK
jgi:hypothetical protein